MGLAQIKREEQAYRIKNINSEVLSNLAHEFLTPLSVISLNVQILERIEASVSGGQSQKSAHFIGNIKQQVLRMQEVVQDSMELLKIDTFNEQVSMKNVDLIEILEGIESSVSLSKQKILSSIITKSDDISITTDPRLLRASIFRLVNHACITQVDEQIPELILRESKDHYSVEIHNHSLKLEEDDFNHIFDPFKRTTELEKIEGMSLALTVIKDRLRLIGAKFRVSPIQSGVKYSIRLPKVNS